MISKTETKDLLVILTAVAVGAAILKFLLDGVIINAGVLTFNLGHIDSMTYAAFLSPILGAHSYMKSSQPPVKVNTPLTGKEEA